MFGGGAKDGNNSMFGGGDEESGGSIFGNDNSKSTLANVNLPKVGVFQEPNAFEKCFPNLTFKQRLYGFGGCAASGWMLSLIGFTLILLIYLFTYLLIYVFTYSFTLSRFIYINRWTNTS